MGRSLSAGSAPPSAVPHRGAALGAAPATATMRAMPAGRGNARASPYVELDRAAWAALARRRRAAAHAPRRSTGCAASATSSTSTRSSRSTCRCPACSACTSRPPAGLHRAQEEFLDRAAPAAHAVRDRARRLGRGRQVDDRPGAPADARPLARAPVGRAGHHRRLPATPTPSSSAAACCTARASRSPTTAGRCSGSSIDIKSGKDEVEAPIYSHLVYDVVPDEKVVVKQPRHRDHRGPQRPAAGAGPRRRPHRPGGQRLLRLQRLRRRRAPTDIRRWYVDRFLRLRETAFRDPASYFASYAALTDDEAVDEAQPDLGLDQRPEPDAERPADPLAGRRWCCARTRDHSVRYVRLRKV